MNFMQSKMTCVSELYDEAKRTIFERIFLRSKNFAHTIPGRIIVRQKCEKSRDCKYKEMRF